MIRTDSLASSSNVFSADGFRLVVTGSGRSGTGFTATLLTSSGIVCGHEEIFGPWVKDFISLGRLRNDASWLAAPHLTSLPARTLVVHQTRHPLAVARSYLGIGFFAEASMEVSRGDVVGASTRKGRAILFSGGSRLLKDGGILGSRHARRADFIGFVRKHAPAVLEGKTELERFNRFWLHWNLLIESGAKKAGLSYIRCRVEDWSADLVLHVAEEAGAASLISRRSVEAALQSTPPDINSRERKSDYEWSELKRARGGEEVEELAHLYGYE